MKNTADQRLLESAYLKVYEDMDPNSEEANKANFNKQLNLAKETGKRFFELLNGITDMTWDNTLPENTLEELVAYMETGLNYQMATDIKAHLLRALRDVASSQKL